MGERDPQRRDRLIQEHTHDPYKLRRKDADPLVCPECGAVYEDSRWRWGTVPEGAADQLCQACRRIADHYPAGEVHLSGGFLAANREEILGLARNQERLEKGEHPLHRILAIEEDEAAMTITTTDIHLPRRIGQALHSAYKGTLEVRYDEEGYFIRVNWQRD